MDKLSIYEFLSFFLPGVTAMYITYQLLPTQLYFLKTTSDLFDGLMAGSLALLTGLIIHRLSFLLLKYKWYAWLVYPGIEVILSKSKEIPKQNYLLLKQRKEHENDTADEVFDKAYYYLEYHDKIGTAKMFQSMYFFLRNQVTLCICSIPVISISLIFFYNSGSIVFVVILIFALLVICTIIKFYRRKMIERIFGTYWVALQK